MTSVGLSGIRIEHLREKLYHAESPWAKDATTLLTSSFENMRKLKGPLQYFHVWCLFGVVVG